MRSDGRRLEIVDDSKADSVGEFRLGQDDADHGTVDGRLRVVRPATCEPSANPDRGADGADRGRRHRPGKAGAVLGGGRPCCEVSHSREYRGEQPPGQGGSLHVSSMDALEELMPLQHRSCQAACQRSESFRAMRKKTIPTPTRTATWGQTAPTGSSRQKIFWKPSMAQALRVRSPIFCIFSGIRKRGYMLPPRADMRRIARFEIATSCMRERDTDASMRPKVDDAIAVATVMTTNPGRWPARSTPKTSAPQANISVS